MRELPPLDVHAHVATDVSALDLEKLGAVVLIATRSLADYALVESRTDRVSVWGVGCHPSLVGVQRAFDAVAFERALDGTPFLAEVGPDGFSRVPLETQVANRSAVLDIVDRSPRLVSLHSHNASAELLDVLSGRPAIAGLVLHWWLGEEDQTRQATALGCYYSINYSMVRAGDGWRSIPLNRLLVETDHPAGDRFWRAPRQPGRVQSVEQVIAKAHGVSEQAIRRQVWTNFNKLVHETATEPLFPSPVRRMLASSGREVWVGVLTSAEDS